MVYGICKISLQLDEMSVCLFHKSHECKELIYETILIIWDEAPMMNRLIFKAVNYHLKNICESGKAFGGSWSFLGEGF